MADTGQEQLELCLLYFRQRKVFEKLFRGFRKKYESLGHMGGTVVLKNLSAEEREQLGGFLGKDFYGTKQVSVSSQAFEEALGKSRFSGISLQEILEHYFGMPMLVKKEEKERKEKEKESFFEQAFSLAAHPSVREWLETCRLEKRNEYRYMEREWAKDAEMLFSVLKVVCVAGEKLPYRNGSYELLPVFAAEMTGNPHAFDSGTMAHYLLSCYLEFLFPDAFEEETSHTEKVWTLFLQAGILKDDLSNSVLIYGFRGLLPDGKFHAGLDGFCAQREPVVLTLLSLSGMERLCPSEERSVLDIYMVENPAVFSYLCKKYPEESFICGNGQQRMAVWMLLSKIPETYRIFYAGDFDPEGLGIAQRLKNRFSERVCLWKYEVELYQKNLTSHAISEQRLKKLDRIELPELAALCACMREKKVAVYQEAMLEEYVCGGESVAIQDTENDVTVQRSTNTRIFEEKPQKL